MSAYPTYESLLRSANPKEVLHVKRSISSILSLCAGVFISILVVLAINLFFGGVLELSAFSPNYPDISLRWLGIVPALLLLNVLRAYHNDLYVFGLHGVTQYQGRLSLNKRVPYVKYSDILSLKVRQDPWGRVLNYGDIDLDTAADAGVEMVVAGVSNPDELSRLVEQLRLNSFKTGMVDAIKPNSEDVHTDDLE